MLPKIDSSQNYHKIFVLVKISILVNISVKIIVWTSIGVTIFEILYFSQNCRKIIQKYRLKQKLFKNLDFSQNFKKICILVKTLKKSWIYSTLITKIPILVKMLEKLDFWQNSGNFSILVINLNFR